MTTNKKQRVTLFINPSVVKHAKAEAIVEGLNLTTLMEKALINYLPKKTVIKKVKTEMEGGEKIWRKLKKKQ